MAFPAIVPGATDQSITIRIIDSTTGVPEEAVEHDTSGISLWYWRPGSTKTAITPAALASLDAAHSDGGIEHIDDGEYRLDLPDAAVASGVNWVVVGGTVTGMIVLGTVIPLNIASAADVVNEWETQSQADPTGFHVNVKEVNGTAQTAGDISALLAALNDISADDVWDEVLHGSKTARQLLGITLAAFAAGKATGGGTTTVTFRDIGDGFNAIVATVDENGNRSAVTLNFS